MTPLEAELVAISDVAFAKRIKQMETGQIAGMPKYERTIRDRALRERTRLPTSVNNCEEQYVLITLAVLCTLGLMFVGIMIVIGLVIF